MFWVRFREMFRRASLAQHDTVGCHSERSRGISWKRFFLLPRGWAFPCHSERSRGISWKRNVRLVFCSSARCFDSASLAQHDRKENVSFRLFYFTVIPSVAEESRGNGLVLSFVRFREMFRQAQHDRGKTLPRDVSTRFACST